jgi:hypothetical protein
MEDAKGPYIGGEIERNGVIGSRAYSIGAPTV